MGAWSKRLGTIVIGGYLVAGCFTAPSCDLDFSGIFVYPDADETPWPDAYGTCPSEYTSSCSPTAQTGCVAGQKCTWVHHGECSYVGCAPAGTIAIGGACGEPDEWASGADECVKGAACVDGECHQVCDNYGGTPSCDSLHACVEHEDIFTHYGFSIAGVCDPGCNPLTQEVSAGSDTVGACGSPTPEMPDKGCYGLYEYACYDVPADVGVTHVDRTLAVVDTYGSLRNNACSPGFIPFFSEATGSTKTLCAGLCAALETDNTPEHMGNSKGDPNALAKLPSEAAPAIGNATCDIGKKGSHESSACLFMWPFVERYDGTLPGGFEVGPYRDTLGVCFATAFFQYDANGDTVLDTTYPDCSTLPPRSDATPGNYDDAADFGCQTLAHSPMGTTFRRARVSTSATVLARHDLR